MSVPTPNRNYSNESVLIAVFSMAALLIHTLTNVRYGYFRDEHYIACARHFDFGYVDQPPLSILLLRLSPTAPGRFAFCDSPPTGIGGGSDSCAHRDNRARDWRTRMGPRFRLPLGDGLRAANAYFSLSRFESQRSRTLAARKKVAVNPKRLLDLA